MKFIARVSGETFEVEAESRYKARGVAAKFFYDKYPELARRGPPWYVLQERVKIRSLEFNREKRCTPPTQKVEED